MRTNESVNTNCRCVGSCLGNLGSDGVLQVVNGE